MHPGSNASGSRRSVQQPQQQQQKQLLGDEIAASAAGGKSMKRMKRVAERNVEGVGKKRFVGVRQRPSGRWVAEIKDTTQKIRLWLGTFDSAEEGAKAYDNAARALRGANTRTNFVSAIASSSSCDSTEPTKVARLIRLRQSAATTSPSPPPPCELRHKPNQAMSRQHSNLHEDWDAHSQEDSSVAQSSAVTSESLSSTILGDYHHPSDGASALSSFSPPPAINSEPLQEIMQAANRDANCESHDDELHPPSKDSFPCATNRADEEEASSFVDDNEVADTPLHDSNGNRSTCHDDATLVVKEDDLKDPLDHRNSAILDMIPWPEYVLMEGLDLMSCETTSSTGVYPAFEFSTEAMDRDSEQYLSDDSSDFLLTLQPISQSSPEFETPCCELYPVSPDALSISDGAGECQGDQALWVSTDLQPLCMVA